MPAGSGANPKEFAKAMMLQIEEALLLALIFADQIIRKVNSGSLYWIRLHPCIRGCQFRFHFRRL